MRPDNVVDLLDYALEKELIVGGKVSIAGKYALLEEFGGHVIRVGSSESQARFEAHEDEVAERSIGRESGVADEGQDDYVDVNDPDEFKAAYAMSRLSAALGEQRDLGAQFDKPTCFALLCMTLGVDCGHYVTSPSQLGRGLVDRLALKKGALVKYMIYGHEDVENHVERVYAKSMYTSVTKEVLVTKGSRQYATGIVSVEDFFDVGGKFYTNRFYADDEVTDVPAQASGLSFGGDSRPAPSVPAASYSRPPPESVVNGGAAGGGANVTGGVVRPKRRVIKARGAYDSASVNLRNYGVVGATMFNNVEEMYLDTISRNLAQEVIEDLFSVWELPLGQPTTMKYAEDLLWAFLVARTASNKADYNVIYEIPTKDGAVDGDFSKFSLLLADKYGITRRNFARGVANDLHEYMLREENQFLRSRASQRVGADPQMGALCFDGSTGCHGLTSSEASFTKLLESRNLYERDDVVAEGASDRLMQGMHGGVRSKIQR